jgi:hypothetical protein
MYKYVFALYAILMAWWGIATAMESPLGVELWVDSYQIMSWVGAIFGFWSAAHWGGKNSVMGRSILAFSIGLLLQSFGQSVYAYYALFGGIEVPYPSLGDLGFFGSIPCYIYGTYLLGRITGVRISLKRYREKVSAVIIPTVLLVSSYSMFLREYDMASVSLLTTILDFGYPLGQAIYVSFAILILILSKKTLGGLMKNPLQFLLFALVVQYAADYMFLYQISRGSWIAGGLNDVVYLLSYVLMTVALIRIYRAFESIKSV